jgi:hypothetical protein
MQFSGNFVKQKKMFDILMTFAFFFIRPVTHCRLEDESTRKEAARSSRKTRRSTRQNTTSLPKEGHQSGACTVRVPKSHRRCLKTTFGSLSKVTLRERTDFRRKRKQLTQKQTKKLNRNLPKTSE